MKQFFILLMLTILSSLSRADLYVHMDCNTNGKIQINNKKSKTLTGSFNLKEKQSQVLTILGSNSEKLLKIFPWYGVDTKVFKGVKILNQNTSDNSSFSFTVLDKKANKIYSLSCVKK